MKSPKKPERIEIQGTESPEYINEALMYNRACDDWELYLKKLVSSNPADLIDKPKGV